MRARIVVILGLLANGVSAAAQAALPTRATELRPVVGMFVPAGAMRDELDLSPLLGAQAALQVSPRFHVVAALGWTFAHSAFLATTATDIYHYDAGIEFNRPVPFNALWTLIPFAGAGGGGRTYDFRMDGAPSSTCAAGYLAAGVELEAEVIGVRGEMRNYLACSPAPVSVERRTRHNVTLALAIAYHRDRVRR